MTSLTSSAGHALSSPLHWCRGNDLNITGWKLQLVGLWRADWSQEWESLRADLPVDPEGHGGEEDADAGVGRRTRNLDALLQTIRPSRQRSVLPCQSYPVVLKVVEREI